MFTRFIEKRFPIGKLEVAFQKKKFKIGLIFHSSFCYCLSMEEKSRFGVVLQKKKKKNTNKVLDLSAGALGIARVRSSPRAHKPNGWPPASHSQSPSPLAMDPLHSSCQSLAPIQNNASLDLHIKGYSR